MPNDVLQVFPARTLSSPYVESLAPMIVTHHASTKSPDGIGDLLLSIEN